MENKENIITKNQIDDIPLCIKEIYYYSEIGNSEKLSELTEKYEYTNSTKIKLLRELFNKFDSKNNEYIKCIQILLSLNININYQIGEDKETILMIILRKGDLDLIKLILEYEENKKEKNKLNEINFQIKDKYNRNAIHYLFKYNQNENDVLEILNYLLENYCKNNKILYNEIISLLDIPDNEGNIPLGICLIKGWYIMTLFLIKIVKKYRHINNKKNNLIHCCVSGSGYSILCLKIILYYSKIEDFDFKNEDSLTPYQLSQQNGNFILCKIILDFEKNFYNQIYKMSFYNESKRYYNNKYNDLIFYTLNCFTNCDYENCIVNLKNCEYYQYYIESGNNEKNINNCSIEWNNLLTKHKLLLNSEKKNEYIINTNKKERNKDNVLKNNKDNQKYNFCFPDQEEFKNFFDKNLKNYELYDLNIENENDTQNFETIHKLAKKHFLLYNKVIFFLKSGDLDSVFLTINLYLLNIFPNSNYIYYKWVLYISSTLILIEIFIYLDYTEIAEMLLHSLKKILKPYNLDKYSIGDETIFNYLNENEIMNQSSKTWDDVFCYINLLKMMLNIKNSKKYAIEYKRLIEGYIYKKELKIFNRLKLLYKCLKIQKYYYLNEQKCLNKLNLLSNELIIFYHNSLGILNLKLKNFFMAEFHFRKALDIYITSLKINGKKSNFDFRIYYICSIEFNIALSYFYQGKYNEAREILLKLSKINIMKNNYKIWFRLGLCSKEIELKKYLNNKNKNIHSSIISIIKEYKSENNNEIKKEKDCISIDLENENENNNDMEINKSKDSIDELYEDFLKEYKYKSEDENLFNKKNISFKRIVLKCTHNPINLFKNSNYSLESINSFKKVIFLSKKNLYKQENIKNILQIYYNKIDKENYEFSSNFKLRVNINILCESYLNLIFCLSLREEWNEIIITIKEFRKRNLKISEEIHIKIEQYEIEAYINLKYYENVKNCIKNCLDKHKDFIQNINLDYFSKRNNEYFEGIYYKINLFYGLALINIKMKNYKDAEENIMKIFNFLSNKNDLPNFFIDLIIYINLIKLDDQNLQNKDNHRFKNNILNMIKIRRTNIKRKINDY